MRSRVSEAAVSTDSRDMMADKPFADALPADAADAAADRAGRLAGEPPGLLPPELIAAWAERIPQLRPRLVPGVNHYTIVFDKAAAAAVAAAITKPAR